MRSWPPPISKMSSRNIMSIERIVVIDLVWRFDYFDMSLITISRRLIPSLVDDDSECGASLRGAKRRSNPEVRNDGLRHRFLSERSGSSYRNGARWRARSAFFAY